MSAVTYEHGLLLDPGLLDGIVQERRRTGMDRFDEVWEGVLHMSPPPSAPHSRVQTNLAIVLGPIAGRRGGEFCIGLGVRKPRSGEASYRVPDAAYLAPEDLPRIGPVYLDGGPAVAFEVLSPGDETYKKFDFYAEVGTRELVVVDPLAARAEVYRLAGEKFVAVAADPEGRTPLAALGVRFQRRDVAGTPALFCTEDGSGAESRIV